jgi:hypothetical protein
MKTLWKWLGLNNEQTPSSKPRLPEADSRGKPGTPGALGGGPDQPPGGPGGTRRDLRYSDQDQEGAQDQPEDYSHYYYEGYNTDDDDGYYHEEDRMHDSDEAFGSFF